MEKSERIYRQALALLTSKTKNITRENIQEALPLLTQAAELKHPEALYLLGEYYYYGILVEQDEARAEELYRQAKKEGSVHGGMLIDAVTLGLDRPTTPMQLAFQEAGLLENQSRYLD